MKILIIQTAFIGDVILATPLIEKLNHHFPKASIDFLLRKGNESLLFNHPKLNEVIVWNKKSGKIFNLLKLILKIRKKKYDYVINLQRFASSGFITFFSGGNTTIGFDKNPFSFMFNKRLKHEIKADGIQHEVERNLTLIESITPAGFFKPVLYPTAADESFVKDLKMQDYVCIAPSSVWFTKQFPVEQWIKLIALLLDGKWQNISNKNNHLIIYLLGASTDKAFCENIKLSFKDERVQILAGKLTLLQTAALMTGAQMNFVNDSAPMHICSAMNAPVTAFFCSTVPGFGFGPLSDNKKVIELRKPLYCRPCGLHGYQACPEKHFKCAFDINLEAEAIRSTTNIFAQ